MGYVALIGAIVGAGISIYQGSSGRRTARMNARAAREMGEYNASMALWEARENANRVLATSAFNSMVNMGLASSKAALAFENAKYNADINWYIGDYNARLLEREEQLLWQEHDLAKYLYKESLKKTTSSITATYAASGIELGNVGEVSEVAIIDHKTQGALQLFIMQHGAEVKAKKLLESAARGRATAAMESNNIMYQGMVSGLGEVTNAKIGAIGNMMQGMFDAEYIKRQGRIKANSMLMGASWTESQYNRQGSQMFTTGLLNAGGQVARGASGYITSTYNPSTDANITELSRLDYTPEPTSYQIGNKFSFESESYDAQLGNPMLWDN
jgi:hypothetical protein